MDGLGWCDCCREIVEPRVTLDRDFGYEYDACPYCGNQLDPVNACPICGQAKSELADFCPDCIQGISSDVYKLLDKWRPQGGDLDDLKYLISEILDK